VSVASAGPYASLHLAPDRQPHQHSITVFFTGRMPFLPLNQRRQSTEGTLARWQKTDLDTKTSAENWHPRTVVRKWKDTSRSNNLFSGQQQIDIGIVIDNSNDRARR